MSKKNENETSAQTKQDTENQETTENPGATPPELASLMQVREILTGPLATDVEQRISDMDRRLDRDLKDFGKTSKTKLEAAEKNFKEDFGKLRAEFEEDRTQYHDRLERLERELRLGLEQMRGEIQDATDRMATNTEELRAELGKEFDAIRGTIQDLFDKVTHKLDEEKVRVREELVDRETLSAALSEVAIRLAPTAGEVHEVDPAHHDVDLDQILDHATSGQV